ncbi:MAG: hypothetical protein KKC76_19375 [Proteobacteria bacterium]|nr:hypothetical protein [Pseudomonadota bacterium]MBU4298341.1 hypothetical protein [Pseudomonadota bacterium]MCG2747919.1 hypothetical protein [Desulfobulbaceae bacterium]
MAKKKITGQSKLATTSSPADSSEDLKLVSRKSQLKPTSFRLTPEDSERLKSITAAVNELSPYKKISETMVVKALLYSGRKIKPENLLKAIREVIL